MSKRVVVSIDDFLVMVEDDEIGLGNTLEYIREIGGMSAIDVGDEAIEKYEAIEQLFNAYVEFIEAMDTL